MPVHDIPFNGLSAICTCADAFHVGPGGRRVAGKRNTRMHFRRVCAAADTRGHTLLQKPRVGEVVVSLCMPTCRVAQKKELTAYIRAVDDTQVLAR